MRALGTADPRTVGPYRVLAELGRGGMGRVLLGNGPDGRLVAVKLVHELFAEDDGFRARFRREVEASLAVSGAYTAAVVDADPDAATPWLASVFVPGPSLHDALTSVGVLPEAAVLRLAAGLATALTHIHRAGLVHRDLKPSNVLITDDGPRVIDFGIVRAVSDGDELTRTGWLVGSPAFMSPEQADGASIGPASDVFSLGSVVVAAATGTSPFAGAATLRTLTNIVQLDPDLSDVPEAVRRIVRPCLAKAPGDRPTAAELLASIGQIAPSVQPWPEPVHRLITRRQAEIAEFLEPGQDATVLLTGPPPRSTLVDTPRPLRTTSADRPQRPTVVAPKRPSWRWFKVGVLLIVLGMLGILLRLSGDWGSSSSGEAPDDDPPEATTTSSTQAPPPFEQVAEIEGASSSVEGLGFSPDGRLLTVRYADDTAQSFDVASQEPVGQIIGFYQGNGVGAPVYGADGTVFITRTENDDAVVAPWVAATGTPRGQPFVADLGRYERPDEPIISPDGRTVIADVGSYAERRSVRLWDVAGRRAVDGFDVEGHSIGFSADGRTFVTARTIDHTQHVYRWDVAGQPVGSPILMPGNEYVRGFTLSADGRVLVTVTSVGNVRWWDTASRNQLRQPVAMKIEDTDTVDLGTITFSPDGAHFTTFGSGVLRVWETDTGKPVGEAMPVSAAAFAPDGSLATGDVAGSTHLWRLPA